MLGEAGLVGDRTVAEAYVGSAGERYWLLRTHEWSDEVPPADHRGQRTRRHPKG